MENLGNLLARYIKYTVQFCIGFGVTSFVVLLLVVIFHTWIQAYR